MRRVFLGGAVLAILLGGCGDDSSGTSDAGDTGGSDGTASTTATTTMTTNASADDSSTASASATASDTGGSETSNGSADGTTTAGGDSSTTGAVTAEGSTTDTDTGDNCFGGMADIDFSYIWIANSAQGTVSKINTYDGVEEARYYTSPDEANIFNAPNDGPSRTSVNLLGDVAVANRNGGITKFAARTEDCIDVNGNGMIDSSTGPLDILPWGEDECMLWHHATPEAPYNEGPRPIAWEAPYDPVTCEIDTNPRLWFGYYDLETNTGIFERLDGETGITLDGVDVAWSGENWGPYGGAVDANGDFWVTGWSTGPGIRIDSDTLQVDVAQPDGFVSFYGMALDADGEPWVGGCGDSTVWHYDTVALEWENVAAGPGCMRGLQVDTEGRAFIAHNGFPCGMVVVDTETEQVIDQNVAIPGCQTPVGVSIDVEGYVWVVDQGGFAFKIDPDTYQIQLTVEGLVQPYTYSDMTGAGLALQIRPM